MLTKYGSTYTAECDDCSEVLDTESEDFEEALGAMKSEGWTVRRENRQWVHRCPCCVENLMNDFEV